MNILFMTLSRMWDVSARGIYSDLLRQFILNGDEVYVLTPLERRFGEKTDLIFQDHCQIVRLKTLNQQKTNFLEKGLGMLMIEAQYRWALKKYFRNVRFDMILYSTPPITLVSPVKYIKNRDKAFSYLLLKDIFPQNSVDIHLLSKKGIRRIIYSYFRRKEKTLYFISDKIGCMSPANVRYVLENNPKIHEGKIEVCPNSIEVQSISMNWMDRAETRKKYGIPPEKKVFLYGGNLGKPQCIPFVLNVLSECKNPEAFFLIVGDGTDFRLIDDFIRTKKPNNVILLQRLPREEFDVLAAAADVGMIFLDARFTIPNFPSRLLGYMQAGIPVLALTDKNTDVGKIVENGKFGWWRESVEPSQAAALIDMICKSDLQEMGDNARMYLLEHYSVDKSASTIIASWNEWKKNENCSN